jgi:hypothetical protein
MPAESGSPIGGPTRGNDPRIRQVLLRTRPAVLAFAVTGLLLTGCSDATGDVDAQGHNGYDLMTCEAAKALALDIEYGTVTAASARSRVSDLTADASRASDQEVRQATQDLLAGFKTGNKRAVKTATTSLVMSCQM